MERRETSLTAAERAAYYLAFASAMVASVLLIAPSVHQRMRSPVDGVARRTYAHVHAAVMVTIVGSAALLVALIAVTYLVSSMVFTAPVAVVAAVVLSLIAFYTWVYQPLVVFRDDR